MKELCETRLKPEMSSYLQMTFPHINPPPSLLLDLDPPWQSSIHALHTATLHIYTYTHIYIYIYNIYIYIYIYIYIGGRWTPLVNQS